jgi:hypothetical protein
MSTLFHLKSHTDNLDWLKFKKKRERERERKLADFSETNFLTDYNRTKVQTISQSFSYSTFTMTY